MRYQDGINSMRYKKAQKFILAGNESYLKDYFVRYAQSVYSENEFLSFYPKNEKDALETLKSDSLVGNRLIVLKNFDKMKVKNFESFPDPSPGDCIIFVLTEKAKTSSKTLNYLFGRSVLVDCAKMKEYGNEYPAWIVSKATGAGYVFRDGSDVDLYKRVGPDLYTLFNEIYKLFIMKEDTKEIDPADITSIVSKTSVSSTYEILDGLLRQNIPQALICFESYSEANDNFVELASFLFNQMEKLYRILLLRDKKTDPEEIAFIVGMPRFMLKTKYLPRALALGKDKIAKKMNALCSLDLQLRKFKGNKKILFEQFIFSFAK